MEFDENKLGAEDKAGIIYSASSYQQNVAPGHPNQRVASPSVRICNRASSTIPKPVNYSSKPYRPEPNVRVSPPKSVVESILHGGIALKTFSTVKPYFFKSSMMNSPPKVSASPKPVTAKPFINPCTFRLQITPDKCTPVAVTKHPPKTFSSTKSLPKCISPMDKRFDFREIIGHNPESEPEKPPEANLYDYDVFEEIILDTGQQRKASFFNFPNTLCKAS